jgi:hypothetical protein
MIHAAVADYMIRTRNKTGFFEFRRKRQEDHLQRLMHLIRPFIDDENNIASLYLALIIDQAVTLSLDLYSTPFETRMHIPEYKESFDPQTMAYVDLHFVPDIQALVQNNQVKFGITPIIRFGDNSTTPARVQVIHHGRVLLRVPQTTLAPGVPPVAPRSDQDRLLYR